VDSEDFRELKEFDCPRKCGAHWCKDCHQEFATGTKHSCDGEAEFEELAKQQQWKRCPGILFLFHSFHPLRALTCLSQDARLWPSRMVDVTNLVASRLGVTRKNGLNIQLSYLTFLQALLLCLRRGDSQDQFNAGDDHRQKSAL
jgi:hypothetical protein